VRALAKGIFADVRRRHALEELNVRRSHHNNKESASNGATDMGPIGDAVVRVAAHIQNLKRDPNANNPISTDSYRPNGSQDLDLCARPDHQVRGHHAGDRSRGTYHRRGEMGCAENKHGRCAKAAQNIEYQEPQVTERILDVVAEYPKEPHVADEMQPADVQEHRAEQSQIAGKQTQAREFARLNRRDQADNVKQGLVGVRERLKTAIPTMTLIAINP